MIIGNKTKYGLSYALFVDRGNKLKVGSGFYITKGGIIEIAKNPMSIRQLQRQEALFGFKVTKLK